MPDEVLARMSVDERERVWRGLLADADGASSTLVAVSGEGCVEGFCSVSAPSRDEDAAEGTAEIAATYVDPPCWSRGVGGALLREASAELLLGGWRESTLWVFAANDRARAFYEGFGFEPDGATTTHEPSGLDVIRMRAVLGD